MTNEQKIAIKGYVGKWIGYYMKLLQNKDMFLEQPDKLPNGLDMDGETVYRDNTDKQDTQELLKFLQTKDISEADFLNECGELRKDTIMENWYNALFRFTDEDIRNSVNKGLSLVGEDVVYGAGFSEKVVLEKVESLFKSRQAGKQLQSTLDEIKKLIGVCETLANEHKLTFDLRICDTDFEYKQINSGGYWYSSSRNC